jgi:hypothetical protein
MVELSSVGTSAAPAPVGGRRRSQKKLRLVKKKTVRRMLAAKGLKMRGGGPPEGATEGAKTAPAPAMGGRRGRSHRRRGKSLFGMRF